MRKWGRKDWVSESGNQISANRDDSDRGADRQLARTAKVIFSGSFKSSIKETPDQGGSSKEMAERRLNKRYILKKKSQKRNLFAAWEMPQLKRAKWTTSFLKCRLGDVRIIWQTHFYLTGCTDEFFASFNIQVITFFFLRELVSLFCLFRLHS